MAIRRFFKLDTSYLTLLGLAAGVLVGLYLPDAGASLNDLGGIYLRLLQMAVLPYIAVTLTVSIGRMSTGQGMRMLKAGGMVLLVGWLLGAAALVLLPMSLPRRESASFFTSSLLEAPAQTNLFEIFVPANIFNAFAESSVPAVVFFSALLGIAVMRKQGKDGLLGPLEVLAAALTSVIRAMARLAPIGCFAIMASTVATTPMEKLANIKAYILLYTGMVALFTFWIVPMLVAAITPFRYGEFMRACREPLIIAVATGSTFVTLPVIIRNLEQLFGRLAIQEDDTSAAPKNLVPLLYPIPNLGRVADLLFIPFSGWFTGALLGLADYSRFIPAGLVSSFGSPLVGMPFLLGMMNLPSELMEIFVVAGVYTSRVGDALGVAHLVAFSLVTASILGGGFALRARQALIFALGAVVLTSGLLISTRFVLDQWLADTYDKDQVIRSMELQEDQAPATIYSRPWPNPVPLFDGMSRLERIRQRRAIRIGFNASNLPFAYLNKKGDLVGLDIALAHSLARGLKARIEFVPFEPATLQDQFQQDHFDIAMSGIEGTTERSGRMRLSTAYMDLHLAMVVPEERRKDFETREKLNEHKGLKVAVVAGSFFEERLMEVKKDITIVRLESNRDFFEKKDLEADILLTSAEAGAAWTLLYPRFKVVSPFEDSIVVPLVCPYAGDEDSRLGSFLDNWLDLKKKDGTLSALYDYWVLGKKTRSQ